MLALWVKVRVKPEARERFLKAIEVDAIGSERDEPGCLCFNVMQDQQDPNVYYFCEVYRDEAAIEAHRAAPHYAVWRAAADTLDALSRRRGAKPYFPPRPIIGSANARDKSAREDRVTAKGAKVTVLMARSADKFTTEARRTRRKGIFALRAASLFSVSPW